MTSPGPRPARVLPRWLAIFALLVASVRSNAAEELDFYRVAELVRSNTAPVFRGAYRFLARSGSYLLATREAPAGLQILDVSNPEAPVEAGTLVLGANGADPGHITAEGTLAVVAFGRNIYFVDISNPASPQLITNQNFGRTISRARLAGNRLLLAETGSLAVVDVSDRSAPALLGRTNINGINDLIVKDGRAWVAFGTRVRAVDISQPEAGFPMGEPLSFGFQADRMTGSSNLLAICGGQSFVLVDISNPAQPVKIANGPPTEGGTGIAIDGNLLFVTSPFRGVVAYDISNPATPVKAGIGVKSSGNGNTSTLVDVVVFPGHAWTAGWNDRLFGFTYRQSPLSFASETAPAVCTPDHFSVSDGSIYVAGDGMISTFSSQTLALTASNSFPARPAGTAAYAFSAGIGAELWNGSLTLFRAGEGLTGGFLGTLTNLPGTFGTTANNRGNIAFASTNRLLLSLQDGGLMSVDVSDPANPVIADRESPGDGISGVISTDGVLVAVESFTPRIAVYRLEPDGKLSPLTTADHGINLFGRLFGLAIEDSRLCALASDKLWVWSLEGGVATYIDRVVTSGIPPGTMSLLMHEGLAYVRLPQNGLEIFDVSAAGSPRRITSNTARSLSYMARDTDRIFAIEVAAPSTCRLVSIPYLPQAPALSIRHAAEGAGLRLSVRARRGERIRLERAVGLNGWETWQRVTNQSDVVELPDAPDAGASTRFYRAVTE